MVTNSEDPKAIEFVKFYLKGQSFLYNQIRKMVGSIIQVVHGNLDSELFMTNSFTNNGVLVALAPGDGLMLEKVAYDRYNEHNTDKKSDIMIQRVTQDEEL
jgi:tRNA U38,U39,U40 pseudouridine synthase TruA